jgi:hypothetical protein
MDEEAPGATDEEGDVGAGTARYSQPEIGRIIAMASELQVREQAAMCQPAGLDRQQVMALASELGLESRHVQAALEVARRDERAVLVAGPAARVRALLVRHFAGVCMTQPMESSVAPCISMEEPAGLRVDWGGRSLRLSLYEGGAGKTLVCWETRLAASETRMLGTKFGGSTLGLAAVACAAAGLGIIAGLFASTALILYAVEKFEISDNERSFADFCRTHLQNVHLLITGENETGAASFLPDRGEAVEPAE